MAKLVELRYELLSHPPYSPDLAPLRFLFISKHEKMAWRKALCIK